MPDSFGARLRQRREERQIDLIAIAERTKIKLTLLKGLERDDVSQWPSGIFRRAYIRTYAQSIGLDPDEMLREFLEAHPDPGDVLAALAAASDDLPRRNGPAPTRLRNIVDSAIESLARLRRPAVGREQPPAGGTVRFDDLPLASAPLPAAPPFPGAARIDAPDEGRRYVSTPAPEVLPVSDQEVLETDLVLQPEEGEAEVDGGAAPAEPAPQPVVHSQVFEQPNEPGRAAHVDARLREQEIEAARATSLEAAAHLCTAFGRVADRDELKVLMRESARLLHASGFIVWLWDGMAEELIPALVQGYPEKVLAYLPRVRRDADNATAAAFRAAAACDVAAAAETSGALVVPLLGPEGCAGVLAIELQHGQEPTRSLRALATLVAAALMQLVHRWELASEEASRQPPLARSPEGRSRPHFGS